MGTARYLVSSSKLWVFEKINHFDAIAAGKMLFAYPLQVHQGSCGFNGLARNIKTKVVVAVFNGFLTGITQRIDLGS